MRMYEIMLARNVIVSLYHNKVPAKLAYKFTKFINDTATEEETYRNQLNNIIDTYGSRDENGQFIVTNGKVAINKDSIDDCNKALSELELLEVASPDVVFDLADLDGIKLSAEEMAPLFEFIKA